MNYPISLLAQIDTLDANAVRDSLPADLLPVVIIGLIVFTLLKFVFKAAFIVVIIGTIVALILSGIVSF